MSTTSISADQNIAPSIKGSAKAIRLTVANPRLPGRREYNLQKVLDNPIHVTDPNIVDLFWWYCSKPVNLALAIIYLS